MAIEEPPSGRFFCGKKSMKTAGIIGGLGPETTAHFYLKVVFACAKKSGKRPNILISNVALPLRIEKELIRDAKNERKILPFLITSAKQLERGGADFIVIPCNTVHMFIKEIRNSVHIRVLSIIEETSKFLKKRKIKKVGLFATSATINNRLFDERFRQNGITILTPNNSDQKKLNSIIHHLVCGKNSEEDRKKFLEIAERLHVQKALLACTDLQLMKLPHTGIHFIDSMDILAKVTVREVNINGRRTFLPAD
jgi:aspartate racemase